jgi:hypothetical protein
MPNGHGGVPFLGSPILLAIMFAVLAWLPVEQHSWFGWPRVGICLFLAALIGWRLAYHLHMWDADDYGGGYTPPEIYRRAARRYRVLAVLYTAVSLSVGFGILWWRGLP